MFAAILRKLFILPIRAYQLFISPLLPQACRFYPSCSSYAVEAILKHGIFKGSAYTIWRLLRCNSLSKGGDDPVPPIPHTTRR